MNTGRLLKTFFVILLVVTLGEIAYYLYYQFGIKKDIRQNNASSLITEPNSISTLPPQEKLYPTIPPGITPLVKQETIQYLKTDLVPHMEYYSTIKANNNIKITLSLEEFGNVGEINLDESTGKLYLSIIDGKGNLVTGYSYSKKNIPENRFFRKNGTDKRNISYKEIKQGEKIVHRKVSDLINPVLNHVIM
ncbi:hypothetical protein COV53_01620 [Candidatus Gottesmanbacteria bacterium CG11_big_fil_rev_8_21_14_0_20_37_11]|uniref:Uncharacterized protein n=1 Tax=Candidatus Gottesmanbacteria bacterium CG11_big_fil_rev_8_21_14_0_20_37_11 TaxID=1974575 RepID=A0A2H0NIK8_9BACT|nr:MAG: hypothetical protein COV53_01620 [Candidatus Gottesmanbacteria bacterium CG11_big_fil_rev_8_21_14_0_20_37_11]